MSSSSVRQLALACGVFFTIGWVAAAFGPALPDLARLTRANLATVGGLITTLFVGALLSQAAGGWLHDRWGIRPLLSVGLAGIVVGVSGVAMSHSIALTLLCGVITGLGHGAVDIGVSLFIALAFEKAGVAALNFTNIFFGLGAVAGPAAASFALARAGTALPALWSAALLALVAFVVVQLTPLPAAQPASARVSSSALPHIRRRQLTLIGILAGLFLLYVGLENGLGSWTTELTHRTTGQSLATGALLASGFWFTLTGGRVVGTYLGTKIAASRLLLLCAGGTTVAAALFLLSPLHPAFLVAGIVLFGFSFGPIYPTAVALTAARFPQAPGPATSLVTSAGSVGGAILPWLQGWLLIQVSAMASLTFVSALAFVMGGVILTLNIGVVRALRFPLAHSGRTEEAATSVHPAGE